MRRRLLRRYLADAQLHPGEVAEAIGVSVEYVQKMLAGSRVVSDAIAWRLYVTIGLPVHILEAWPPRRALPPQPYTALLKEILVWRHHGLSGGVSRTNGQRSAGKVTRG